MAKQFELNITSSNDHKKWQKWLNLRNLIQNSPKIIKFVPNDHDQNWTRDTGTDLQTMNLIPNREPRSGIRELPPPRRLFRILAWLKFLESFLAFGPATEIEIPLKYFQFQLHFEGSDTEGCEIFYMNLQ